MAYEVTATRKRPKDFNALVGQEFVVSTLENAIKENRIAHAYLFSGPRGVGKTSSARLLAKALNCQKGLSAHPCGECESCVEIAQGSSVDVIEIDGASYNGVDAVRAIKEEVTFPPQASRYKIYIIDEVHMLSLSAFNALLKTIEEPPEYVIFIFATTELQKVPQTIRSRCQQFHFQLISQENIVKCLKSAAEDLSIEADEDALYWISKEGAGSMRDSYTLFDQVAAFSEGHITLEKIREKLGIASGDAMAKILRSSYLGDTKTAIETLDELFANGTSETQLLKDMTDYIRCMLFYKAGIRRQELLSFPEQDLAQDVMEMYTKEMLETALKAFMDLYRDMRYSISPRFELELLISRLSSIRFLSSPLETVRKLEEIRNSLKDGKIEVKREIVPVLMQTAISKKKTESVEVQAEPVSTEPLSTPTNCLGQEIPPQAPIQEEEPKHEDVSYTYVEQPQAPRYVEDEERERQQNLSLDDILQRLSQGLKAQGRMTESSYVVSRRIMNAELKDGRISLLTTSTMVRDSLMRLKSLCESILAEATGNNYIFNVSLFVKEEEKLSPEVDYLMKEFKGAELYTIKEKYKRESKPVRNNEAARIPGKPDEADEGGDV